MILVKSRLITPYLYLIVTLADEQLFSYISKPIHCQEWIWVVFLVWRGRVKLHLKHEGQGLLFYRSARGRQFQQMSPMPSKPKKL